MLKVEVTSSVFLSDIESRRVFKEELHKLTMVNGRKSEDLRLKDGTLYAYDEHYHNGAEMLEIITSEDDPAYTVEIAAIKLEKALENRQRQTRR